MMLELPIHQDLDGRAVQRLARAVREALAERGAERPVALAAD